MKTRTLRVTLLLCLTAVLTAYTVAAKAADSIKIGSVLSLTGPASFLGEPTKNVLEHYVKDLNSHGGVLGRKLELIMYDDGGQPDKSSTLTKRLIESDNVDLLISGNTTGVTMAAIPFVERAGIPFVNLAGAVSIIEPTRKWVFKPSFTDRMAAEKVFSDLKRRGMTKLALISEDAGFGKSGKEQSLKMASAYGIEIVADETYSAKDTDVTTQLTKIRNTPGVQAVFNWGFGQGPAIVTKNYRQIGISLPLYQSHGVASKEFIRLAGGAAEGVRLPATGLLAPEQLAATDPQKPVVTSLKQFYEGTFKDEVSTFAGQAYDALMIGVAAIHRAGTTDKEKVRDEIEKTSGFVSTSGLVNMSSSDHMGLNLNGFHMYEIRNGEWRLID
jgi:branched-chain amino acid transport system substrate-binding protein